MKEIRLICYRKLAGLDIVKKVVGVDNKKIPLRSNIEICIIVFSYISIVSKEFLLFHKPYFRLWTHKNTCAQLGFHLWNTVDFANKSWRLFKQSFFGLELLNVSNKKRFRNGNKYFMFYLFTAIKGRTLGSVNTRCWFLKHW